MYALLFMLAFAWQGELPQTETKPAEIDMVQVSYIIGNSIGREMGQDALELDVDSFTQGLRDGLEGKTEIDQATAGQLMQAFQKELMRRRQEIRQAKLKKNMDEAIAFLAENKTKEGVITTASGLQYKWITKGEGPMPKSTDQVKVHYAGRTLDGKEFDSSYKRNSPMTFGVNGVIKGWIEMLQLMPVGSKVQAYVSPELGYGERGSGPGIPPNSALIFDIELIEIVGGAGLNDGRQ